MRRLKIAVCLIFVASCVIFAGYTVKSKMLEDHTPPVINCKDKTVTLSVQTDQKKQKKALLKGVKAEDNRDGDLTSSVRIASMSHFIAPGKRTITYVVFDKANQVGTLERTVQYKDYTPPKIHLKAPLRYSTTEVGKANLTENMKAEDCLDGDLTSQIRTSLDDGMYNAAAGIYKVTVQVSNSAGDVCSVPLEVTVTESGDRQEQMKEYPVLSDYIAYTTVGHEIDPMSYVKGMEMNGATYTYADDGEALAGTREAICEIRSGLFQSRGLSGGIFLYGRGITDCGDKVIRCGTGSGGNTGWKVIIEMTCRHLWILTWIRILLCMI